MSGKLIWSESVGLGIAWPHECHAFGSPSETPETSVCDGNCPAVQRLERELGELRREVSELRCEVGYWKSQHAELARNEQLTEELHQAKGEIRSLQDKLFGRKSEKSAAATAPTICSIPRKSRLPRRNAARSPVMPDTVGATIPICPSRRSSSRCRKNRWPVRSAESRPR